VVARSSWRLFKLHVYAWWEGYDADALLAQLEQPNLQKSRAKAESTELTIPPLAPWESARIRIKQLVWGPGYDKPGGPDHVLGLVKPFGLDPSKSMMEFGAGLGGGARTVAHDYGVWITAFEGDTELAHAGKQLSIMAGLDRKAELQFYMPHDFQLSPNSFDCILSHEALASYGDKYGILEHFQHALKARGQLSITDFVLAPGVSPDDERLADVKPGFADLWQPEEYERRFRELNLDLRVTEDMTAKYRQMILASWTAFSQGDEMTLATARAYPTAVTAELDLWTKRLNALNAGLLQVIRFYAIKKGGAKLMSDW
jgi:cyclopropane fatty-acyl-phospholipid synthase-like methyltransferase